MSETKAVVTVAEMARMCGLSRARFYQLMKAGAFPPPLYDVRTRRPIYVEELQKVCLEVRRRNCGIDGRAILFYARRTPSTPLPKPTKKPPAKNLENASVIEGLKGLGLTAVTAAQLGDAMKVLFPNGVSGFDQADVIRAVFLHLKRRDTGDSVGR